MHSSAPAVRFRAAGAMSAAVAVMAFLGAGLLWLTAGPSPAQADEGMWLYDRVPVQQIEAGYGFAPSQEWLDHLRLASAAPGASASFVSPNGLIITNHHVAVGSAQRLSTPEHDYVREGFYAATPDQEIPIPGNTIEVLLSITDVTDRVQAVTTPEMDPAVAKEARDRQIAAIEKECLQRSGPEGEVTGKGEVVSLYGGAVYDLYRYKQYNDIRLVFLPEQQAAFFGGDWDNFCYPRHDLDFALMRAYENGKPAHVEDWLQVEPRGIGDGDLVFVSGNPGSTDRLKTLACLDYRRDVVYPERLAHLRRQREALAAYRARGEEQARRGKTIDFFYGNSIKRTEGELAGLHDAHLIAKKTEQENALREAVAADPALASEYGSLWDQAAAAYDWATAHDEDIRYRSEMPGSRFLGMALQLVRYGAEIGKPDGERLPGYHDAELPRMLRRIRSPSPVYKDMEEVLAAESFAELRDHLGDNDPFVQAVLQGRTPAGAAAAYLEGTRLDDVAFRRELLADEGRAIAGSHDPLLALARRLDPGLRANQKAYRENVQAVEQEADTRLARVRFAVYGDQLYPDATGTLRLSYGKVAGYPFATSLVPPFTTFYGLYDRAYSFGDEGDFQLTPREVERRDRLDLSCPLDFVCTADITGGNSGSPVVDREGRLVGLVFDGNSTSHANQFVYDETTARSVCVDIRAVLQAMRVLYDAQPLVDEMLGQGQPGT
jgi:hypothetical protein